MKTLFFSLAALTLTLTGAAWAQAPTAAKSPVLFPFVLPWDDAAPGTITDVSFLNAKPVGVNGYITPMQGHFVEGKTGKRIRFLGTNFVAKAAFPTHADAEKVAARLAKLGINLVRLHHMDHSGWGAASTLWDTHYKDQQHIDAGQLDKLDFLVSQFKKNGIYVNLNLHVSRQFTEADGFPASVSQIPFKFDKRVDEFDRRMIALQKNYARDLLTHVNPYTGLSYADDPAVAVVEINNENSLVGSAGATLGVGLDSLPEPFRGELVGLWNDWLLKKYGTDAKLQAAWIAGLTPTGRGLLTGDSPWSIEHQGTSQAKVVWDSNPDSSPPLIANLFLPAPNIHVNITQADGTDWHVQVHQTGLDLHNGEIYTVKFRAKADAARSMPVFASLDQTDWHNIGLRVNAALTPDWQTYTYVFTAHDTLPTHARLAFVLGGQKGTVWIAGLQIHPSVKNAGLPPDQSLAKKNIGIPTLAQKNAHDDWIAFLADTERSYAEEMRAYLKTDLHVHANIICSQISWGGLTALNRESNMDFADNHAYWQHPSFPHRAWDPKDWTIQNTPMVSDLANGGGGALRDLAENRVTDKPYTVSEYNEPAPSDYRAETLPLLATVAAFQDWDAIYLFDYGDYGTGVQNDKINGYFGISSDPAKTAFLPAAAIIFRVSNARSSPDAVMAIVPKDQSLSLHSASSVWNEVMNQGGGTFSPLEWRLRLALDSKDGTNISNETLMPRIISIETLTPRIANTTDIWSVNVSSSARATYSADSHTAQSVVGYIGGQTVTLGQNIFTFPRFGNNFAAVALTAMDQKSIALSRRMLLTLVGKVENQGMIWNASRTSVGDQWGQGPTVAEGIPATVTLKTDGGARHVWALDGTGKRKEEVSATYANGSLTFIVGPQFKTLWYEIGE